MNTPLQPDDPSPRHHAPEKNFEALMRSHAKQLENIPSEMRIAPLPPSDAEAEETKDYIRKNLGLSIAETPCSKIFLANEILERACILEGRIGEWEGIVAFLFLYRFQKTIKSIYIVPTDGLDARMIAKAILWGYLSDLPPKYAQSDIVGSERFYAVKTFDLGKLANKQALEKFKDEYRTAKEVELQNARSSRLSSDLRANASEQQLDELKIENADLTTRLTAAHNSSYRWNMAAILAMASIPIAVLLMHCFKF